MRYSETVPGVIAGLVLLGMSFVTGNATAGSKESVLYRFNGGKDGNSPMAGMIADSAGNLYGTTTQGGGAANCTGGCGTVFELSPPAQQGRKWSETILYGFQGGNDGATPSSSLIADESGNLYGATSAGGGDCNNANMVSCGTIFELVRPQNAGSAWTETVLYSFLGNPNGKGNGDLAWPNGIAFDQAGNLYGLAYSGGHCTTDETGTYCNGGAFSLTSQGGAWVENVLYRFSGETGDPAGPVLDSTGRIYGTAPGGDQYNCGVVFRLAPPKAQGEWNISTLYSFECGLDGAFPQPGLTFDVAGNLYGMSLGAFGNPSNVFELSPMQGGVWSESVLYNFSQVANGYTPTAGPILGTSGSLYGTTQGGGKSDAGVVFVLKPPRKQGQNWTERVLHSFAVGKGGFAPYGRLTFGKDNALYGTTPVGGNGPGTVFEVVP